MKSNLNQILDGSIHIETNFFDNIDLYKSIIKEMLQTNTKETYQPWSANYGNRMQGMPCYESLFNFKKDYIINKIEKTLNLNVIDYNCIYRKIITEELKKSQCNGRYGFIHEDSKAIKTNQSVLSAVMHFEQSFNGGTAFFENNYDKIPDIYVSAYPNRMILYNGKRWHAPAFDYSFKERNSLAFFLVVKDRL